MSPFQILLVEDNLGDIELIADILGRASVPCTLTSVRTGIEALAFVTRQDRYVDAPRPDLIILDLNLPRKDGRSLLRELKQLDSLRSTPILVYTSSDAPEDICDCYQSHANAYVVKPERLGDAEAKLRSIIDFWFQTVRLPT